MDIMLTNYYGNNMDEDDFFFKIRFNILPMGLLTTIKERWNAEEPKFFNGIKNVAIALGTPSTAVWLANSTMNLHLPEMILNVCKYSITACAAMGLTAKLTKKDNPII
jgi:hypothetical protein